MSEDRAPAEPSPPTVIPELVPIAIDLSAPGAWDEIERRFGERGSLTRLSAWVIRLHAKTAILEAGYVDRDYRSEYANYYAHAFRDRSSLTHRLHLFGKSFADELRDPSTPTSLVDRKYLGYVVLRPIRSAPLGRTMLKAPDGVSANLTCTVTETVNVFGTPLTVTGFPFIAQDFHFGVCANADAWMVAYYHHLRFRGAPRVTPAMLGGGTTPTQAPFPSAAPGVELREMQAMLKRAALPTKRYPVHSLPKGAHVHEIVCRYLDSGLPVILATSDHVVIAVGYRKNAARWSRPQVELLVHDDIKGPYQQLGDPSAPTYGKWTNLIVPLPPKIWSLPEMVEIQAQQRLKERLRLTVEGKDLVARFGRDVTLRTVAVESNEFKDTLTTRGCTDEIAVHYRRMPLPRWLWVVEIVAGQGQPDLERPVVGEVLIDPTDHARDARVLAWRAADQFFFWPPERAPAPVAVNPHAHLSLLRPRGLR